MSTHDAAKEIAAQLAPLTEHERNTLTALFTGGEQ